jgi:hypothetical protein
MGVRSEYRRRFDSTAAALQDAQAELEEKRRADIRRHAQAANRQQEQQEREQRRANGEPPWQGELEENEALRYAASVSAPVSRSADSYSYSPPRLKPSDIKLSVEQAALKPGKAANHQTYGANDAVDGKANETYTEQCDKYSGTHHRQKTYYEQHCCQESPGR